MQSSQKILCGGGSQMGKAGELRSQQLGLGGKYHVQIAGKFWCLMFEKSFMYLNLLALTGEASAESLHSSACHGDAFRFRIAFIPRPCVTRGGACRVGTSKDYVLPR